MGLGFRDNGKENGSHYSILGSYRGSEKNMEATIRGLYKGHYRDIVGVYMSYCLNSLEGDYVGDYIAPFL